MALGEVDVLEDTAAVDRLGGAEGDVVLDPGLVIMLPTSSTAATAAKLVFMLKTELNAAHIHQSDEIVCRRAYPPSAWTPVFAGLVSAAVFALAHVSFAV
jgi:hypothetical protein